MVGANSAGHPIQSFAASVAASPQQSRNPHPESSSMSELDRYWSRRRELFAAKASALSREHEVPPNRTTTNPQRQGSVHSHRRPGAEGQRRESAPDQVRQRSGPEPWPGFWRKQRREKEDEEDVIVIEDSDDEDPQQQPEPAPRDWLSGPRSAHHLAESTRSSLRRRPDDMGRNPCPPAPDTRTLLDTAEDEWRRPSAYSLPSRQSPPGPDGLLESLGSKRDTRQQRSLAEGEDDAVDGESFWAHRYAEMRRSRSLRTEDSSRPSPSEIPLPQASSPRDDIHGSGRNWSTSPPPDHSVMHQQPGMGAASSWFASLLPKPISSLLLPSPARGPTRSDPLAPPRHLSPPRSSRGSRAERRSHHQREEVMEEAEEEEAGLVPPPLPRPSWLSATKRPQPRRLSDSDSRHDGLRRQQQQPVFSQGGSPTEPCQQQQQSPQQPSSRLPTSSALQLLPSSASPPAQVTPNGAAAAASVVTAIVCRKMPQGSLRKRPASRKQEAPVRIVRARPAPAAAPVPALLEPQPPSDQDSDPGEQPRSAASLSLEASILSNEPLEQGEQQQRQQRQRQQQQRQQQQRQQQQRQQQQQQRRQQEQQQRRQQEQQQQEQRQAQQERQQRRRRQGVVLQSKAARWEEQNESPPLSSSLSPPYKAGRRGRKSQQPKRTPAKVAKEAPQKQKQGTKRKHSDAPKTSGSSKAEGGGEEGKNKKRQYRPCVCMKGKAVYGLLGDDREGARWCVGCPSRPSHAVDVYRKRCDCGISQPSFALPGTLLKDAKWCSLCPGKPAAAVNVRSKRCECGRSQPSFGPPTGGKLGNARWCKVCPNKPPNAPNFRIRSKFEIHQKRRLNLSAGIKNPVGRPRGSKNSTPPGGQGERRGAGRPSGSGAGGRGPGKPPGSGAGGRGPGRPPGPASFTARMAALRRRQQQQKQQQQPVLRFPDHLKRERQLPLLRSGWGMDTVERRLRQRVADDGGLGGAPKALRPRMDNDSPKKQQQQSQSQNGSWAPSLAVLRAQQEKSDPDDNLLDL